MNPEYDHVFKVLLVGDLGSGKSSLLLRYTDDTFTHSYIPSIGIDFKIKTININDLSIKLQVWDTTRTKFRPMPTSYYRGAHCVILVYDTTNEKSFGNIISNWMEEVERYSRDNVSRIIVGTKCDLIDKKVVESNIVKAFATSMGIRYLESSAKDNINVEEVFIMATKHILQNRFIVSGNGTAIQNPPSNSPPKPNHCLTM